MYELSNIFSEFTHNYKTIEETPLYIREIASLLIENNFSVDNLNAILKQHNILDSKDIKLESLDFLLAYADFILIDNIIFENELKDFRILKLRKVIL